jgi:glycosyltransferase involved in cell wall biosynthesis
MIKKKYIVNAMGMHSFKYGGMEKYLVLLAEELYKKNIVLIVIYNSEPRAKNFLNDIIKAGGEVIISNAMHPLNYFITFIKIFIKYKPILVHAHFQIYYSVIFAKLFFCNNVFFNINGLRIDKNYKYIESIKDIPLKIRLFRNIIHKNADYIFAISNAAKQQYTILFPVVKSKIDTQYLGSMPNNNLPALCREKLNILGKQIIIGIICFKSPVKGLDILLDAMAILKNEFKYNDFVVCQIGIDPLDPSNKDYLDDCNHKELDDNIKWMGIRNDVLELLPGMDIYCQPSRAEALGFSIIEAGMAGLPIVGSRVGGIPETVKEGINGFLFESGNARQLAEALFKLIKDPELRKLYGKNSKDNFIKNFNIHSNVNEVCTKYLKKLNFE